MDVREKLPIDDAILILTEELKQRSDGYTTHLAHGGKGDSAEEANLDALAMAISALEQKKWISVKDERKPKQLQECLCVCQFDDDEKGEWRFYNVLKWHDVPYQDNGIVNRPHFTDEGVHGMVVTHWMPLPKLPQPPKGE